MNIKINDNVTKQLDLGGTSGFLKLDVVELLLIFLELDPHYTQSMLHS